MLKRAASRASDIVTFDHACIPYEEQLLLRFFGDEYRRYCDSTSIGIPGMAWAIRKKN